MKCIDPLVTGYERGTFEERSAQTESSPRQSGKNSEDDSRANNNIRETLGILSLSASAPALSYALAPGDAAPVSTLAAPPAGGCVFFMLADRYMRLSTEEAGALLVVALVTKAPGKLSDPLIIVLGPQRSLGTSTKGPLRPWSRVQCWP